VAMKEKEFKKEQNEKRKAKMDLF
jgi:hypothetical protein